MTEANRQFPESFNRSANLALNPDPRRFKSEFSRDKVHHPLDIQREADRPIRPQRQERVAEAAEPLTVTLRW
jgi:hypothetical protein